MMKIVQHPESKHGGAVDECPHELLQDSKELDGLLPLSISSNHTAYASSLLSFAFEHGKRTWVNQSSTSVSD